MSNNLVKLEQSLGYKFQNLALLERALTHRSWAYEQMPFGKDDEIRELHNESLEFLGDSILGLAVADYLFSNHPKATEGELTLMKHRLVNTETLAKLSENLDLGSFLKFGRGEEKTGGRKKQALLADVFEAVLAAIFCDSGYTVAKNFVHRTFKDEFRQITPQSAIDYKTLLQEKLQAQKLLPPTYQVIKTEGPPHKRIFYVKAILDGKNYEGKGTSIKSAEMDAANVALKKLENQ
jgi:ribonuclease III